MLQLCSPTVRAVTLKSAAITFHLNQSFVVVQFDELMLVKQSRKQPSLQWLFRNHCAPQLSPRRSPLQDVRALVCVPMSSDAGVAAAGSTVFSGRGPSTAPAGLGNLRLYASARV